MFLIFAKSILIPYVVAMFIYLTIKPLIASVQKYTKTSKLVATLIITAAFLLLSFLVVYFVSTSIGHFIKTADNYLDQLNGLYSQIIALAAKYKIDMAPIMVQLKVWTGNITKYLGSSIFSIISNMLIIMIFTLFFLAVQTTKNAKSYQDTQVITKMVTKYLQIKFLISLVTGFCFWMLLAILGVPMSIMFGILTFMLNFIPNIGSVIATVLPVPIIYLTHGFGVTMIVYLALGTTIQFTLGSIIDPKLMGQTVGLHPATILFFLVFWGLIWGIPGMFLAVPITVVLTIVLKRIDVTRGVAEILEGKWSLDN